MTQAEHTPWRMVSPGDWNIDGPGDFEYVALGISDDAPLVFVVNGAGDSFTEMVTRADAITDALNQPATANTHATLEAMVTDLLQAVVFANEALKAQGAGKTHGYAAAKMDRLIERARALLKEGASS